MFSKKNHFFNQYTSKNRKKSMAGRFPAVPHDDDYELDAEEYKKLQLILLKRRRQNLRLHFNPFELTEEIFQEAYR